MKDERLRYRIDSMDQFSIRLSARHARHAREIGDGNMGLGIRITLENNEKRRRMILPVTTERRVLQRRNG
jgi:hypothetical protein